MIPAITALLVCQLAGELLARGLHLPVPGPVLGMIMLLIGLLVRGRDGEPPPALAQVADALLGNLGLLFVPAGVGVVLYGPLLARNWAPIAVAILVGTILAIAVTGRLAQALLRRFG
ncbi:MAG: CidA/LrgA family protein [Pseudomonadota bacterium]|nr:CidA/LrgA family protein [Pseudomonadota bacterium]